MPVRFSLCRAQVTRYKPEMIRNPPIILKTDVADYILFRIQRLNTITAREHIYKLISSRITSKLIHTFPGKLSFPVKASTARQTELVEEGYTVPP